MFYEKDSDNIIDNVDVSCFFFTVPGSAAVAFKLGKANTIKEDIK